MNFLVEFMRGLVLSAVAQPRPIAVDFALAADGFVLVALAGWWQSDWSLGVGVLVLRGDLTEDFYGIALGPDAHLLEPSDDEQRREVQNGRNACRLDIDVYRAALLSLRDVVTPGWLPQLDAWIDAVSALPDWSIPQPEFVVTEHRAVGFVPVTGDTEIESDVLVIDATGSFAVARGNAWLESIGSQWAAFTVEDRPDITAFLGWVADQTLYGSAILGQPSVGSAEGTMEGIALRSVPSIV